MSMKNLMKALDHYRRLTGPQRIPRKELLELWGYARHDIEAEKVMESIAKEAP